MPVTPLPSRSLRKQTGSRRSPFFQRIFDSAGPFMLAIGTDGCITEMNAAAERQLGFRTANAAGPIRFTDLLAPGEIARIGAAIHKATGLDADLGMDSGLTGIMDALSILPPGEAVILETQLRREDETLFPATLHLSALRDERERTLGMVVSGFERPATAPRTDELKR